MVSVLARLFRWIKRRPVVAGLFVALLAVAITPIIVITRTWLIVHPNEFPNSLPGDIQLEKQSESFTCGVHALSMVYGAYGLDGERECIRWRLGADTKALFWMGDSTGTLHPDLYMVLGQDHFEVKSVNVGRETGWRELLGHLENGHLAILLIKRRENGNLHWVVASDLVDGRINIYDSLAEFPYVEDKAFYERYLVSALLVEPTHEKAPALASIGYHLNGSSALREATERLRELE